MWSIHCRIWQLKGGLDGRVGGAWRAKRRNVFEFRNSNPSLRPLVIEGLAFWRKTKHKRKVWQLKSSKLK
jgi:hypothetical protein